MTKTTHHVYENHQKDIKVLHQNYWCMTCSFRFVAEVLQKDTPYTDCPRCDNKSMKVYVHYMSKSFEVF